MDAESAPPPWAEFEVIVQSFVLALDCSVTWTAPPARAVFEVIIQRVNMTAESPSALTAPPKDKA